MLRNGSLKKGFKFDHSFVLSYLIFIHSIFDCYFRILLIYNILVNTFYFYKIVIHIYILMYLIKFKNFKIVICTHVLAMKDSVFVRIYFIYFGVNLIRRSW